jgi:hypothetical protein
MITMGARLQCRQASAARAVLPFFLILTNRVAPCRAVGVPSKNLDALCALRQQ